MTAHSHLVACDVSDCGYPVAGQQDVLRDDLIAFEAAADFQDAWHRIIEARPRTMSLVVRVTDWGPRVTYEWSNPSPTVGYNSPATSTIGPKDDPALAAFQDALTAADARLLAATAVAESPR